MELGEAVDDSVIQERLEQQSPCSCVSMVSTVSHMHVFIVLHAAVCM